MIPIILLDRDGTINEDNNYYLGMASNWRTKQAKIINGVIPGLQRLSEIPNLQLHVITNQAGVSIIHPEEFLNLTEDRVDEVNQHFDELLKRHGVNILSWQVCYDIDNAYAEKAESRGWKVDESYITQNPSHLKPNPGMILDILREQSLRREDCLIYVIGDRTSDLQTALNMGGKGILVPGLKTIEVGDMEKLAEIRQDSEIKSRTFTAHDFEIAANWIIRDLREAA